MNETTPICIYCEQSSQHVPLLPFIFNDQQHWICPQHLPILIHKPEQLSDKLPGMQINPVEPHH